MKNGYKGMNNHKWVNTSTTKSKQKRQKKKKRKKRKEKRINNKQ
jgi:hypothetical protein